MEALHAVPHLIEFPYGSITICTASPLKHSCPRGPTTIDTFHILPISGKLEASEKWTYSIGTPTLHLVTELLQARERLDYKRIQIQSQISRLCGSATTHSVVGRMNPNPNFWQTR